VALVSAARLVQKMSDLSVGV